MTKIQKPKLQVLFNRLALTIDAIDSDEDSSGNEQEMDYSIGTIVAFGDDVPNTLKSIGAKVIFDHEDALLLTVDDQEIAIISDKEILLVLS